MPAITVPTAILNNSDYTKIDKVVNAFLASSKAFLYTSEFVKDESRHVRGTYNTRQVYTSYPENRKEIEKILDAIAGKKDSSNQYQRPCNQATFVAAAFAWYNGIAVEAKAPKKARRVKALSVTFKQPAGNPLAYVPNSIENVPSEDYCPYSLFINA